MTEYYYKNPTLGTTIPTVSDADFVAFKTFLKKQNFNFDSESELALKNTLAAAKKDKIDDAITVEYNQLLAAIQKSEEAQLNQNQKEIKNLILDEIIKRYQYKEGLYQYYIKNNIEVKKATSILSNEAEYNKILNK